jgi:membrane protein
VDLRAGEWWGRVHTFLSEGMWRAELQPRTWTARGVALLQFAAMVAQGFVRDRLLLRASALTYFTALAIVPLLAIVGSVLTALGVTENVIGAVVERIQDAFPEVGAKILGFVEEANIAGLGTLGAVTLFLTTVLGISNIERALNHIWGVTQNRPWSRRLPDYLAVLIVAPLLLGVGLSLATTVKSQWIVQRLLAYPGFELLYDLGFRQLPTLVLVVAFGFLYWFLPNTRVRPFASLLGGLFAALAVNASLGLYVKLGVGFARADALYGGFAQFPLFFVFVYFFWAIVLLGAEVAFAYQNLELYRREVRGERTGPAEREAIGLRIAVEIARAFRDTSRPLSADDLSDALRVPVRSVRAVLARLQEARIVSALDASEKENGYQLGRPAERIHVIDVLTALRGSRDPMTGDRRAAETVEALLAEVEEGATKGAAGRTLADVLDGLPPAPESAPGVRVASAARSPRADR